MTTTRDIGPLDSLAFIIPASVISVLLAGATVALAVYYFRVFG